MAITVIVRQGGEDVPWTFDDSSRAEAMQFRDDAERRRIFVAWVDTSERRSPAEGLIRGIPRQS